MSVLVISNIPRGFADQLPLVNNARPTPRRAKLHARELSENTPCFSAPPPTVPLFRIRNSDFVCSRQEATATEREHLPTQPLDGDRASGCAPRVCVAFPQFRSSAFLFDPLRLRAVFASLFHWKVVASLELQPFGKNRQACSYKIARSALHWSTPFAERPPPEPRER